MQNPLEQHSLLEHSLLQQGVDLMLYGMGTVFVFLTLLVVLTSIMSKIIQRFFPPPQVPVVTDEMTALSSGFQVGPKQVDPKIVQAIKLAIEQHRRGS